jgi:hypothetical protein
MPRRTIPPACPFPSVRHRHHERAHRGFLLPRRARPVGVVGLPQQSRVEIPGSAPRLPGGPQCVEDESRQEPDGPDS